MKIQVLFAVCGAVIGAIISFVMKSMFGNFAYIWIFAGALFGLAFSFCDFK